MNDQTIEQEIQAKGLTAPRVTPQDIENEIASAHYFTAEHAVHGAVSHGQDSGTFAGDWEVPRSIQALGLITFCVLVLRNDFTVVGKSACASPENFDAELGRKIARQDAVNQVWPLLGFRLRDKLAAKPQPASFKDRVINERIELDEKLNKLSAFINSSDTFAELPSDEQDRLTAQYAAMTDYSSALAERIAAF